MPMFLATVKCSKCKEPLKIESAKVDIYGLEMELEPCDRCLTEREDEGIATGEMRSDHMHEAEKQEGYVQ